MQVYLMLVLSSNEIFSYMFMIAKIFRKFIGDFKVFQWLKQLGQQLEF